MARVALRGITNWVAETQPVSQALGVEVASRGAEESLAGIPWAGRATLTGLFAPQTLLE